MSLSYNPMNISSVQEFANLGIIFVFRCSGGAGGFGVRVIVKLAVAVHVRVYHSYGLKISFSASSTI